jgi:hypothetical protein
VCIMYVAVVGFIYGEFVKCSEFFGSDERTALVSFVVNLSIDPVRIETRVIISCFDKLDGPI